MKGTKNFKATEFRCKCPICKLQVPHKMDPLVLEKVQELRDLYGAPLSLTSAYRCAEHPEEKRKKKPGQHHAGTAVDIRVSDGVMRRKLVEIGLALGARGVGVANSFVHLDWREDTPVFFVY